MKECEFCGETFEVYNPIVDKQGPFGYGMLPSPNRVYWEVDPFAEEIHNDQTKHWICHECFYQCSMDI